MDTSPNPKDRVIDSNWNDFRLLSDMKIPLLRELLTKQNLYDAELSLINFLDKIFKSFIRLLLELGTNFCLLQ